MSGAAMGIVRERGIRGLYSGLSVTLLEIIPYAAFQFGLYDAFNKAYTNARVGDCCVDLCLCHCVDCNDSSMHMCDTKATLNMHHTHHAHPQNTHPQNTHPQDTPP